MTVGYKLLPGQVLWQNGVSSYVFGAENSTEYVTPNLNTSNALQQLVKAAGFTVLRNYIPDNSSDATIDAYLAATQACRCAMLTCLPNPNNASWNEHVVTRLGSNCLMYELGNEPDLNGIDVATYSSGWNTQIPVMRGINPNAVFIGPALGTPFDTTYLSTWLTNCMTSSVLPDGVSFHSYPANSVTDPASALAFASTFATNINNIRSTVIGILYREVPICLTEWNIYASNPIAEYMKDDGFTALWTTQAMASIIAGNPAMAIQFTAASGAGTFANGHLGALDMIDTGTATPKGQYYALLQATAQNLPYAQCPTAKRRGTYLDTYAPTILADTPQVYYRMNEKQGTVLYDSSGHTNHALLSGTYTLSAAGALVTDNDTCVSFNPTGAGGTGHADIVSSFKTDGWAAITIEFWMQITTTILFTPFIIENENNVLGNHIGFSVSLSPAGPTLKPLTFTVGNGTAAASASIGAAGTAPLPVGVWHHYVLMYDGTRVRAFLDTVQDLQATSFTGTIGTATHNVRIACDLNNGGHLPAMLDEIAIFNYALSYKQIQAHYNAGVSSRRDLALLPTAHR